MSKILSNIGFVIRSIAIILHTMLFSCLAILFSFLGSKKSYFFLSRYWSKGLLFFAGVNVNLHGEEFLNGLQSRVYVVNHASYFDIPILLASLPDDIRIMYRDNLQKIPFLGWTLKLSPFIGIDRSDARNAMKGIQQAIEAVKVGESVIVFAEGTRSVSGRIGKFKRGAFMLAARSQKPIVPVALIGAHAIMPKGSQKFSPGTVHVHILEPLMPIEQECKGVETDMLNEVYSRICSVLPEDLQPLKESNNE